MPIVNRTKVVAADPAAQARKTAKRKIDSLENRIDQARTAKQGSTTVDQRKRQNQKIRDFHQQLDTVRNDRDKKIQQINKGK